MKITRNDSMRLVVEDRSLFPGIFCLPGALFILYSLAREWRSESLSRADLFWGLVAAVMFLTATAVFNEWRRFDFSGVEQTVHWWRLGLFGRKAGSLPFHSITNVVVQHLQDSAGLGSCRLSLITEGGETPLTRHYTAGTLEECEEIGKAIRGFLKRDAARIIEDSIVYLAAKGRRTYAVKLARERFGLGLTEAVDFVDRLLKQSRHAPGAR